MQFAPGFKLRAYIGFRFPTVAVNYGAVQMLHLWRSCLRLFFNVLKRYLLNLYYIEPSISSCAQMTYTVI
jgi:hypothetical protein